MLSTLKMTINKRRREISPLFFPKEDTKLASRVRRKKKYALKEYLACVKSRGAYLKIKKKELIIAER